MRLVSLDLWSIQAKKNHLSIWVTTAGTNIFKKNLVSFQFYQARYYCLLHIHAAMDLPPNEKTPVRKIHACQFDICTCVPILHTWVPVQYTCVSILQTFVQVIPTFAQVKRTLHKSYIPLHKSYRTYLRRSRTYLRRSRTYLRASPSKMAVTLFSLAQMMKVNPNFDLKYWRKYLMFYNCSTSFS